MVICLSFDLHDLTYVDTGVHQPKPISSMLFTCLRWFSGDYFHLLENQNCQDIFAWC